MTYSSLVSKFYDKAAEKRIKMNGKLDFMISISPNIEQAISEFEIFKNEFMNFTRINQVFQNVPDEFEIDETAARWLVRGDIDEINHVHLVRFRRKIEEIYTELEADSPSIFNSMFDESYENWIRNPTSKNHIQRIDKDMNSMEMEFQRLQQKYNATIKAANQLKATILTDNNLANVLFERLIIETDVQRAKECTEEIVTTLDGISSKMYNIYNVLNHIFVFLTVLGISSDENSLLEQLEKIKKILEAYNLQRTMWAEFLIRMRLALPSYPKPVKPEKLANLKKRTLNACCNCALVRENMLLT